jgi:catechol 2,3-dioxygenase-like lactoylglutathione lyase family enzyme
MTSHFILFVSDQDASRRFYSAALAAESTLDVPGMTEFRLGQDAILGLMPEDGIIRLLGTAIGHPSAARSSPRSELYLLVDDPAAFHARAISAGAREVSPLTLRDWGHVAAYSLDPDGHLLAFAGVAGKA